MRIGSSLPALFLLGGLLTGGAAADQPPRSEGKDRYAVLSRLIHKTLAGRLARVHEDASGWGQTIPVPEKLRRPRLRRTYVKVGDHTELPQGTWRKVRVWLDDPDNDLVVDVRALRKLDASTYHLQVDADVQLSGEADVQQWLRGLLLLDATGQADAAVRVRVDCDIKVALAGKLPPEVKVEPRVTDLNIDLKDFVLRKVQLHRAGLTVEGDAAGQVGDEFRGALQTLLRTAAPRIRAQANEAIARALRECRGTLSAADLLRAVTPTRKEK